LQVIQQAKSLKVLVIGDSCLDKFIYGTCDRLSPEAPVPVLKHTTTNEMPGMAGNVVENVKAFSNNVELLTQDCEVTKVRYVDSKSNQHIMRFDIEPSIDRSDDIFCVNSKQAISAIAGNYDVVILSDYNKGFLKSEQIESLTSKIGQQIYADSKKKNISCFKNSIVKLNEKESLTASSTLDKTSILLKTLGKRGASCNGSIYPAYPVEVFDVSGAGDTFLTSFSIYHSVAGNIREAIIFANKCSSIVVQRKGTYALLSKDILVNKIN